MTKTQYIDRLNNCITKFYVRRGYNHGLYLYLWRLANEEAARATDFQTEIDPHFENEDYQFSKAYGNSLG